MPLRSASGQTFPYQRKFMTFRAVMALVLREMATRYGRSPGGYLWAILEPLGAILILAVGFSLLMDNPPLGSSFLLFYATGFLPFNLYQTLSQVVSHAINFSRPLLHYPAVTWVDSVLARFFLNGMTGLLVSLILMLGILAVTDSRVVIDLPPILLGLSLAMLLGIGVGTLNCVLTGLFPVWIQIWSIATRPLFIVSGIFFLYDDMPSRLREILWFNPLVHIIAYMRRGFFPMYSADYTSAIFVTFCGLIPLCLGIILMGRYHRDILHNN